jgi:hypothetical protein
MWFHYDSLADYYNVEIFSERHWEIIESFMKTYVEMGMNTILTPIFTPPLDTVIGGERPTVQLVDVTRENGKYTFGFDKLRRWCEMCRRVGVKEHVHSVEYAADIMEAFITNKPFEIGGNVLNTGRLMTNLPEEACVEVPCMVNANGVQPCRVGALPVQCAAMNMTNIYVQLLTIEAAYTRKKEHIYQAAMLDPHTASELTIDEIRSLVDDLIEAHGNWLPEFH